MHLWEMSLAPCGTFVHSCYHFYSLTSISREMTRVPKLFSRGGWKTRTNPFEEISPSSKNCLPTHIFFCGNFCTYREALTSIWLSTLWIKSVGFFGCFASESPTHKTGQMSFGPRSSIEISSYLYRRPYTSGAQYVISKCSMNDCSQRSCVSWAILNRIGSIQLT